MPAEGLRTRLPSTVKYSAGASLSATADSMPVVLPIRAKSENSKRNALAHSPTTGGSSNESAGALRTERPGHSSSVGMKVRIVTVSGHPFSLYRYRRLMRPNER